MAAASTMKPILASRTAALALFWLALEGLVACEKQQAPSEVTRPTLTVEAVAAEQTTWPDSLVASGEVSAWQEAVIGSETSGLRLAEVLVDVGDHVRKGQRLARFRDDLPRAELVRLDAAVAEAAATLAKAQSDASRGLKLHDSGAVSGQLLESYQTQVQIGQAQLASAQASRDVQALHLADTTVVAPDDGMISSRMATLGAVGGAGQELFRLVRQSRIEWRAEIPSEASAYLAIGSEVRIRRADGSEVGAKLRQLAPTVNTRTRSMIAYVDVPADSGLSAGMYATGRFVLVARAATVVPESAIVLRDGNRYLMRVSADQRIHELKVRTGRRQGEAIEILSPLALGDHFVKSGGAFVTDGDLVHVLSSATAAAR
jgi:HlyD family secretion protein